MYERDECLPCPNGKNKSVSGDEESLCLDACDGITNLVNVARTACGELRSLFSKGCVCSQGGGRVALGPCSFGDRVALVPCPFRG